MGRPIAIDDDHFSRSRSKKTDIYFFIICQKFFLVFKNVVGVTVGGTLGHAICTGFAVLGGRMVAQRISVRTGNFPKNFYLGRKFKRESFLVTLIGGVVFILFALSALILNPEES